MKRLLVLSLNGDPAARYGTTHAGGQCKFILELGKNLVLKGWDIDVVTIRNPGVEANTVITEGFNVYRFPLPGNRSYDYNICEEHLESINYDIRSFIISSRTRYDLILACYWLSGDIALILKNELSIKSIVTYCSLGLFKKNVQNDFSINQRIKKEKFIAKEMDHIIATNDAEYEALINEYGIETGKVSIVPRGIDLDVFYEKSN